MSAVSVQRVDGRALLERQIAKTSGSKVSPGTDQGSGHTLSYANYVRNIGADTLLRFVNSGNLSTDGKSTIVYKKIGYEAGERTTEIVSAVIEYDPDSLPDPKITSRSEISLDGPGEKETRLEKAQIARALARKIKENVKSGQSRYITQDQQRTTYRNFLGALMHAARELDMDAIELGLDNDVLVLTAYNCLRTNADQYLVPQDKKEEGFLEAFPNGIFDRYFLERVKTLTKHYLVDLRGIDNAEAIESIDKATLIEGGLEIVDRTFQRPDLCKLLCSGYLEGENPPIRLWRMNYDKKWASEDGVLLIGRGLRNVLKYDLGAINPDDTYNLEAFESISWKDVFSTNKYGLNNALNYCPFLNNTLDAVRVACPGLIGIDAGQLPPWKVTFNGMWQYADSDSKRLIDDVTEYVVERKLKCVSDSNTVSADKIRGVKDWDKEYNKVASGCLSASNLKAHEALKRKYSHLFGLEKDQIKPWEIMYSGMWSGNEGQKLFRLAFAYVLYDSGLGNFDFSHQPPVFSFTANEFKSWYDLRFSEAGKTLKKHLIANGLGGGLKQVSGDNLKEAVRILFNIEDDALIPSTRDIRQVFIQLLEPKAAVCDEVDEPCTINIQDVRRDRNTELAQFEGQTDPYPWHLAGLRKFYMENKPTAVTNDEEDFTQSFDLRKYVEGENSAKPTDNTDEVLNYTRLAYDMLLFSLRKNIPVDQVFSQFSIRKIDISEDKTDFSCLYPCEVFLLACNLNRLQLPDDLAEVDSPDFREFDYESALSMVIKAFDVPNTDSGREILNEFIWTDEEAQRYVEPAFRNARSRALTFNLKIAQAA